jgi:hypothetical protein
MWKRFVGSLRVGVLRVGKPKPSVHPHPADGSGVIAVAPSGESLPHFTVIFF